MRVFYLLFSLFMTAIFGILSHEMGHKLVADHLRIQNTLHYNMVTLHYEYLSYGSELYHRYCEKEKVPKIEMDIYEDLKIKSTKTRLLIALGGPLQTMLTGILGFLILVFRKEKRKDNLYVTDWLAVFMTLFWLRQPYVLLSSCLQYLIGKSDNLYGGDEANIANILGIYEGTFSIITAFCALFFIYYVLLHVVPKNERFQFATILPIGSIAGYLFWMYFLGPLLLP